MNKYEIKNIASNVIAHGYEAEVPVAHQPEWGYLERSKPASECSEQELEDALDTYMEGEIEFKTLPQTYEVVVTNIDAIVEEREAAKIAKESALDRLQSCDPDSATTIASLRTIVKDLLAALID